MPVVLAVNIAVVLFLFILISIFTLTKQMKMLDATFNLITIAFIALLSQLFIGLIMFVAG